MTAAEAGVTCIHRAGAEGLARLIAAVNRTVAEEAAIKSKIAVFKEGVNLTPRLSIDQDGGWFGPLVHDLLAQGASVVVNDIGLIAPVCETVERLTGVPADWVFQQNLYITPREVQGFVPHCDPHVVIAAQLYGHKEWMIYDKVLDNPLIVDGGKDVLVADPSETLVIKERIKVEPGDVFVIPRGTFHAACAHEGASVHMAIGCAGIRPVDYIWAMAGEAMNESALRADMSPAASQQAARDYLARAQAHPGTLPLPRHPVMPMNIPKGPISLSFQGALDALSSH
ncbi:MAG: hypothetical protein ACI82H_001434 [Alphaproteobacteria bacterium]|jgi:hypothetical protein